MFAEASNNIGRAAVAREQRLCSWVHIAQTMLVGLAGLSLLCGCGYNFRGAGLAAPEGVSTVAITIFGNRTIETGVETVFATELVDEFTRTKILKVTGQDSADAFIGGTITSIGTDTISHTASLGSDERRVFVTTEAFLKRKTDGAILWTDSSLSDQEAYRVAPSDRTVTDKNKREAIEKVLKRMAQNIHNRILWDF